MLINTNYFSTELQSRLGLKSLIAGSETKRQNVKSEGRLESSLAS